MWFLKENPQVEVREHIPWVFPRPFWLFCMASLMGRVRVLVAAPTTPSPKANLSHLISLSTNPPKLEMLCSALFFSYYTALFIYQFIAEIVLRVD